MSKELVDAATRLVAGSCPHDAVARYALPRFHELLWSALARAGYPGVGIPESSGGSGGSFGDALTVLRVLGRHAAAVPFAETGVLGGWLLSAAGWQVPDGPLAAVALAPGQLSAEARRDGSLLLNGTLNKVAWLGEARELVTLRDDGKTAQVVRIPTDRLAIRLGRNMAGEGRDRVHFDNQVVPAAAVRDVGRDISRAEFRARGAATRVALIAGALDRMLELTVRYTGERVQFGRPINQFQAAQHRLAQLAAEVGLAGSVADALSEAAGFDPVEIAAAKSVAGSAAEAAAAQAHQLHGAIGITREYPLNFFTRRVWSWRSEYGSAAEWNAWLGASLNAANDPWTELARD
jgi:acyl-CoA dehydrogenase